MITTQTGRRGDAVTPLAIVAIGSNEGDSVAIVRRAMGLLTRFAATGLRASSLWRTSPVDCPPESNDFINGAVAFEVRHDLSPEGLLRELKTIEREFGRVDAAVRNAPRALDLDLILFGDERRSTATFELPHPRGHLRRFVLAPAAEVAPDVHWPGRDRTIAELLAELEGGESAERLDA